MEVDLLYNVIVVFCGMVRGKEERASWSSVSFQYVGYRHAVAIGTLL